jgi:hypothetical protein
MQQLFEQAETHAENIAKLVASYYQALLKAGVPDDLACELTHIMNQRFWLSK